MNDFCITTDAVFLKNDIDILIQEIDTLFDTTRGELLGEIDHATDFEKFLWNTNIGTKTIEGYIVNTIKNKCDTFDFEITCKCTAFLGTENDIILVEIFIENENYTAKRIYKIE